MWSSLKKMFQNSRLRRFLLCLIDICLYLAVCIFCYFILNCIDTRLHFDFAVYGINCLVLLCCILLMRVLLGVYSNVWRYTNSMASLKMIFADGAGCVIAIIALWGISRQRSGIYNGVWLLLSIASMFALLTLASRFSYRWLYKRIKHHDGTVADLHKIPVAIVGAGQIGALLAEELIYNHRSNYLPVFFIDTDKSKVGSRVAGLKVYYQDEKILDFIENQHVSEIFIALTNVDSENATKLFEFYSRTSCKIKIYDTPITEINDANGLSGKRRVQIRDFRIEDLLFRKSLVVNDSESFRFYRDKTVLVTGGGGSIGSELCRQIAKCSPKKLVILDIYENNAYDIQQELIRTYGDRLDLAVEIASVRDRDRLDCIFQAYHPDIVFHAAAHKHVPLMEHSACEAIKNNVVGTYNTADMAEKYHVQKFILVSTDKAVNPTNIMGASKRMCEMVIQCRVDSETTFAAVRFGNVLGSNGSVIPLFKRQIASGGPLTLTDKRIIRYFMTIPEASQLVIQAGAMAKKGELFVLDMGRPVKIYDLAVNMIRMSGLEPNVDIQIQEVGLRPGEKLYEELLMKNESLTKTDNNMIFIEKDTPLSRKEVDEKMELLCRAVEDGKNELASPRIKQAIRKAVPTFCDPVTVNQCAETSEEMKAVNC